MTAPLWSLAAVALPLLALSRRLRSRRARRLRAEGERMWADWQAFREALTVQQRMTIRQAAALVHRAPSTLHGWMSLGLLPRQDPGGRGVPAQVLMIDVLKAERQVRGRGRPPSSARPA